jgi:hypothetical protein
MRNTVAEFFSTQLNIDPDIFSETIDALEKITDKKQVLERFYEENHEKARRVLADIGLTYPKAEELYTTIKEDVRKLDKQMFEALGHLNYLESKGCYNLMSAALALHQDRTGFFIKRNVAERLMRENPPKNIMDNLGYPSVDKMLENEDLFEIYAALRFAESSDWMNTTYIAAYRKLSKDDFEERPVEIRVLDRSKWEQLAERFLKEKLHSMSHLKELGVIFLIPKDDLTEAATLYMFVMTNHYIDEILTYSRYFKYQIEQTLFGKKMVSALRCDVPDISLSHNDPNKWLIIQRYLYKYNPEDPRLGTAHVNPEALYHRGASHTFFKIGNMKPKLDFKIWEHTNYLALWLPNSSGEQDLVNFNFMDNIMNVMNNKNFSERYYYHFREALWNKIFINYFSVDKLEGAIVQHLLDGWFDIRKI